MTEYLFSYGTLQKEKVQLELFGRIFQGAPDTLRGHKTTVIEIKDETFLARGEQSNQLTVIISDNKTDAVQGTVLELTKEELLLVDQYEPDGYGRIRVVLESGKQAWLYVAVETT
jgi:gamma-glutamylcyclotransferase (GGCT)/AIG2-like uncharacterized protein YtfP